MGATQGFIARDILTAHKFGRYRHILDVGGGEGAFLSAVGKAERSPQLTLLDLPSVAERARRRFEEAGLGQRATALGGDFLQDPLPAGADLITFVRVLHDHDDAVVKTLLQKAYDALLPGGRVIVAEPMAGTKGAAAMGDAYFGMYLWAMGTGEPRSAERIISELKGAGFSTAKLVPTRRPVLMRLILAEK
jgi:demethylspheroidene O-methyltransferase